jgi:hypothetical protein
MSFISRYFVRDVETGGNLSLMRIQISRCIVIVVPRLRWIPVVSWLSLRSVVGPSVGYVRDVERHRAVLLWLMLRICVPCAAGVGWWLPGEGS